MNHGTVDETEQIDMFMHFYNLIHYVEHESKFLIRFAVTMEST